MVEKKIEWITTSQISKILDCSKSHARWLANNKFKKENRKDISGQTYLVVLKNDVVEYGKVKQSRGFPRGRKRKSEQEGQNE